MGRRIKGIIIVIVVILIIASMVLTMTQFPTDNSRIEKKIDWSVDLKGSYPLEVNMFEDGSSTVIMGDIPMGWWLSHRADVYGVTNDGDIRWSRTFFNVTAVACGTDDTTFIGGKLTRLDDKSYIVGIDGSNHTEMMVDCGNITLTSLAISDDGAMFALYYTHDTIGILGVPEGTHWMMKMDQSGEVQWKKECDGTKLIFMPNGTLAVLKPSMVQGISKDDGTILWQYMLPDIQNIWMITNDVIYYRSNDGGLVCFDLDGTVRWKLLNTDEDNNMVAVAVDGSGNTYYENYSTDSPMKKFLNAVDMDGDPLFTKEMPYYWGLSGLDDGIVYSQEGEIVALDENGEILWSMEMTTTGFERSVRGIDGEILIISGNRETITSKMMCIVDK